MAGNAPNEGDNAVDELSQPFLGGVIGDPPAFVEDASLARQNVGADGSPSSCVTAGGIIIPP
jgi:hypothetical protein